MARAQRRRVLSEQLLLSVAEQLKMPLIQISRRAELANFRQQHIAGEPLRSDAHAPISALRFGSRTSSHTALPPEVREIEEATYQAFRDIQTTADMSIRLLDNYLFGARLALEDEYQLQLEPVSLSSVLYDTGQQLDATAKLYGVDLELNLGGKFGPVLANRQGLQSALVSLGYALIEAMPSLGGKSMTLQLAAHRCRYGLVAGLYSETEQLTAEALRQGRKLYGHSRQPLATLTHSSGAGIFVADAILQAMDSELKVSRHHKLYGLGTVLRPNPQLQLV